VGKGGLSFVFWRGCWSQAGRRGELGRAIPGFQWGEEKGAGFATTQHPRSDHCGGIPTCCAVQEAGTRHTTSTPRRLQTQLRTSLPLPHATNLRPQPSPPVDTTITDSKTTGLPITGLFLHRDIPPYLSVRLVTEFRCSEKSSPRGKEATSVWRTHLLQAN